MSWTWEFALRFRHAQGYRYGVVVDENFALLRFDDVGDEFGEVGQTPHLRVVVVVIMEVMVVMVVWMGRIAMMSGVRMITVVCAVVAGVCVCV